MRLHTALAAALLPAAHSAAVPAAVPAAAPAAAPAAPGSGDHQVLHPQSDWSSRNCKEGTFLPGGAEWLLASASCSGRDFPNFAAVCSSSHDFGNPSARTIISGKCPKGQVCLQYHSYSLYSQPMYDVACGPADHMIHFPVDTYAHGPHSMCGPAWTNDKDQHMHANFVINIYNEHQTDIEPAPSIIYLVGGRVKGSYRNEAVMQQQIDVPPHGAVKVCVGGKPGQLLHVRAGMYNVFWS
ncbi:uncharacterized protein UV8b_04770 [Ustilaginoidea virens]|uniref:Uncharacterized protein n=1 Tax=Ustilaginoidea virens TaxID=1159556 RepID=A0A8E5HS27_USTVR|nr:uncharacterized protein UV8b_04770 [Ustilaginoidea virens]QUC20529.1 hypothetical protein UV8b_04770 [Ustilaginoidea virens]